MVVLSKISIKIENMHKLHIYIHVNVVDVINLYPESSDQCCSYNE